MNVARSKVESTQPLQDRITALTKENAALKEQLAVAPQETVASTMVTTGKSLTKPVITDKNATLLKRLREENSYLRHLLEEYAEKVPEMKPRLRKYTQEAQP